MNIWIFIVAFVIVVGRQIYLDTSQMENKFLGRLRVFVVEFFVTSIVLTLLFLLGRWIVGLF
jgi:hypothetical protein